MVRRKVSTAKFRIGIINIEDMNVKRLLNVWGAEMCFLSLFAIAVFVFGFVVWQSEAYKKKGDLLKTIRNGILQPLLSITLTKRIV